MNIWKSLRGLPRDIWVLSGATLINRTGTMVLPFLVLYLTRELGFTPARAGLALAVYGVGAIIVAPFAGRLCDRIGALPVMRASLIGAAILLFIFPAVTSYRGIIALTLVWAIVSESFRPANLTMITSVVAPEQRKPAFALNRLAINLGMSIGPAAAGFLAAQSFRWIFIVDAVTTLIAGVVLVMVPVAAASRADSSMRGEHEGGDQLRSSLRSRVVDDRRMVFFLAALFLTGVVFFQHEGALPLFLVQDLQLSPAFYGILFTINTVMIVFMEVPLNAATAHWPHHRGLSLGSMLFALGSGAFAFASGPEVVVLGIVVWTFGEMLLFPQASAYVAEIAPAHRTGEYMGAYSLAFSVAFAIAPWAGTVGFATFGAKPLWLAVFVVGSVSAAMMTRVRGEPTNAAAVPA